MLYGEVPFQNLNSVPSYCASETSERGFLGSTRKRQWSCKSGKFSAKGIIIASGAITALFPSDSIVRSTSIAIRGFLCARCLEGNRCTRDIR